MSDKVITSTGDCSACCGGTPSECDCALYIPPLDSPYADYATAATAISDLTSNCIGYSPWNGGGRVLTATDLGTSLVLAMTYTGTAGNPGPFGGYDMWAYVSVSAGNTLTSTGANNGGGSAQVTVLIVYANDGTAVGTFVGTAGAAAVSTALTDGCYIIKTYVSNPTFEFTTSSNTITSSGSLLVSPVIALYDDSGTTRQLEACPKLLLPILTENTGTWYADCASASSDLTNALIVSNCVGYNGGAAIPGTSFTATDGGSSLTLAVSAGMFPLLSVGPLWGSVNCEAGQTISVAWAASGTATVLIYDYTGALIDTLSSASSPLTSSALPYTGRYTVKYSLFFSTPIFSDSAVITSSGVLSVNPIQALYDTGLDCPARLNCGDSC